jgi:hypothetical protein
MSRRKITYTMPICQCGHDEDEHNLGFFTSTRPCKVGGCSCTDYRYSHKETRVRKAP